jgi:MFS family permease
MAGIVGDRVRRKTLIVGGLVFWSLITIATSLSTRYWHLVLFRGLEGLGEAFYFPASMSLLSDYHGKDTRSRAMSLHQSSVYAGTIAGGWAAGYFAEHYGWRTGFYVFGTLGVVLGIILTRALVEPVRGKSEGAESANEFTELPPSRDDPLDAIGRLLRMPMYLILIAVFAGANFVAAIFLTWMPSYLGRKFGMDLAMAGLNGTAWLQVASVLGVLSGGWLADRWAKRHRAGRMMTQALGLFAGVPFLFLTGWTLSVPVLVLAMIGFGYFKGLYDANIWASLFDVVEPRRRATAQGLMNSIAWIGGGVGSVAIAAAAPHFGMGACLSATSLIYLLVGTLLVVGVRAFMVPSRAQGQSAVAFANHVDGNLGK